MISSLLLPRAITEKHKVNITVVCMEVTIQCLYSEKNETIQAMRAKKKYKALGNESYIAVNKLNERSCGFICNMNEVGKCDILMPAGP